MIDLQVETEDVIVAKMVSLLFKNNLHLVNYLNCKYDNCKFYVMANPVTLSADGTAEIFARSTITSFQLTNAISDKCLENKYIINKVVVPIINEMIAKFNTNEIYLYGIWSDMFDVDLHAGSIKQGFVFKGYAVPNNNTKIT